MRAFSEQHIALISQNYGTDPDHKKPEVFRFATRPEYAAMRNQIREWVETYIPEGSRGKFINDLGLDTHFRSKFSELLVAHKLSQLGYKINYEPAMRNSKTPDWLVSTKDGSSHFFVEVYTPRIPANIAKIEGQWGELSARIEEKRLGYGISIVAGRQCPAPGTQHAKLMANIVET